MGKQESAFFIDMLFISIHWQLFMTIIWGVVFLHFICFPFFLRECRYLHWNPFCFCLCPFIAPLPVPSPPHTDEQPVKVKRKKSFNLSRKFPFYKSKENIVQELVESEREYPLCDQRGWWFYFPFFWSPSCPCFSSLYHLSTPGMSGVMASLSSLPQCPREKPHMKLEMWASLWCVCVSVCGLQRSVQLCMWAPGCINYPTLTLLLL